MSDPFVPVAEADGWITDRITPVELAWRGGIELRGILGKLVVRHGPRGVGPFFQAGVEALALLVRGEREVQDRDGGSNICTSGGRRGACAARPR